MGIHSQEVAFGFGQMGGAYLNSTAVDFIPPTGSVVVAIVCLDATSFTTLTPDTSGYLDGTTGAAGTGAAAFIGTSAVVGANGTEADLIGATDSFSKGTVLLGRWTKININQGRLLLHFAPAV